MVQDAFGKCPRIKKTIRAICQFLIAVKIRLQCCLATESKGRLHPTNAPYFKSMQTSSQVDSALELSPTGLNNFVLWIGNLRDGLSIHCKKEFWW